MGQNASSCKYNSNYGELLGIYKVDKAAAPVSFCTISLVAI